MSNTSLGYKNQLQKLLSNASDGVDNIYYSLKSELQDEILGEKVKREQVDKETKELYDLLNKYICEKIIRKKLPWKIRLLNKVNYRGMGIKSSGLIMISFCFNENYSNSFERTFSIEEIKKLM